MREDDGVDERGAIEMILHVEDRRRSKSTMRVKEFKESEFMSVRIVEILLKMMKTGIRRGIRRGHENENFFL